MNYFEIAPPVHLQRYVECFWQFESGMVDTETSMHVIVPDGTVSISGIFMAKGQNFAGLSGPSLTAHRAALIPHTKYAGIRLRAGAAGSVLKTDITRLRDCLGPVSEPVPEAIAIFQAAISKMEAKGDVFLSMQSAAETIVEASLPLDQPVYDYCTAIMRSNGQAILSDLASEAPISIRQLRRRFVYQCGLSAKEFARLRRARHACLLMLENPGDSVAQTANNAGFADQAHMAREFTKMFGNSTRLVSDYLQQIRHGNLVYDQI